MTGQMLRLGIACLIIGIGAFVWGLVSHSMADIGVGVLFITIPFAFKRYNRWQYKRHTDLPQRGREE